MLLISWNVAGLSTTLNRIDKDYSSSSNATVQAAPKRSRSHAFAHFLKLHGDPDILCIQEHKIPLHQLSSRSEPFGCADLDGYESFWSCCVDKSRKGFNGVVTFVKRGMVQGANVRPLECDVLDDQGRTVLTDHGNFVVFNVYVPASCGMPLSYKMKFLNALRRAIKGQKGKKVILVGDLNISHTGIDVHWSYRSIPVNDLIHHGGDHVFKEGKDDEGNVWKLQVSQHWEMIQNALSTMEAIPITTKNVATGSTFQKYRARVTVKKLDLEKKVFLGGYESCVERCLSCFNFEEVTYYDEDLERECIARESNVVPLDTLAELMSKIAGIEWDVSTIRTISNSVANLKKSSPPAKWLSDVLKEDGMVDAFRHLFPNAEGRYTCWNQQTNCRFENIGTRIDYTIVDEALIQFLDNNGSQKLRCCHFSDETKNFGSEEAALHAAVASGLFQGASFEGGGIATATQRALETQFGESHTGIIYTAPQYSDHVAVSLLLNEKFDEAYISRSLALQGKDTKLAQPHKRQQSISVFFSCSTGSVNSSVMRSSSAKRKDVSKSQNLQKKNKGTIVEHFSKKMK